MRRGKAPSSNGCETRPTTVAPVGSSQGGSWRQRQGLKHSGVNGLLSAFQRTCGPERGKLCLRPANTCLPAFRSRHFHSKGSLLSGRHGRNIPFATIIIYKNHSGIPCRMQKKRTSRSAPSAVLSCLPPRPPQVQLSRVAQDGSISPAPQALRLRLWTVHLRQPLAGFGNHAFSSVYDRGGTRISHRGPLARLSFLSIVTSGQLSTSASATYQAS